MIHALETSLDGPTVVLGLTARNLDRLADNRPMRTSSAAVGLRPSFEIWLLGGAAVADIHGDLRGIGVETADGDVDRGLIRIFTHWVGRSARTGRYPLTQPVFVLGVTADADARLRAGEEYESRPAGASAAVRLLAGPDTDVLGARITSGRRPHIHLDMREGRTD